MTGLSKAHRASSSDHRPLRRSSVCLGATLGLVAILAAGCQSELGDGNPTEGGFIPPGQGGPSTPLPPGMTIDPVTGLPTPANPEGNPAVVPGMVERPPANIGGVVGQVWDANGNNLPVDQLPALEACETPGPQVLRRLNTPQFRNTLASVFGAELVPDSNPLNDARTLGYFVDADDLLVQNLDAQAIGGLSEELSAAVVANAGLMSQLSNNCTDLNNPGCAQQFVQNLGERLFREPLDEARANEYEGLFSVTGPNGEQLVTSFNDGAELVIQAMVQSPYMIYRREIGTQQNGAFALSQFEIASELSYMLTNNPPDEELMAAARNGQLSDSGQLLAQADRLIATASAEDVLGDFVTAWLDLDRVVTQVKEREDITPELREAMLEETRRLFLEVYRAGGTIGDLFSATYTFMNEELANFYGMNGMVTGQDFQRVEVGGARSPGLLGQASYLAGHALSNNSSPVQRAFVVRERILCNDLPPVPTDLDTNLKAPVPGATSRERYAAHSSSGVCYSCHQLMDPVGFTFEGFDGYGLARTTEADKPVDTTGALPLMNGGDPAGISVPMANVTDLSNYFAESEQARACFASNLAYYSYGIANETKWSAADKACTDNYIRQVARDSGNTLESVLTAILTAPHFTRRVQAK